MLTGQRRSKRIRDQTELSEPKESQPKKRRSKKNKKTSFEVDQAPALAPVSPQINTGSDMQLLEATQPLPIQSAPVEPAQTKKVSDTPLPIPLAQADPADSEPHSSNQNVVEAGQPQQSSKKRKKKDLFYSHFTDYYAFDEDSHFTHFKY